MRLKLGKTPARSGAVELRLDTYLTDQVPQAPAAFGHADLVRAWGMLGNDRVGDCVFAGAGHETMLWNEEGGHPVRFTVESVLADYSAVTGYDPADPSTDQGTDMQVAASYRRKTGVVDAAGTRHTIDAYVSVAVGSAEEHATAAYLFGAVGVGIRFPSSAMDQFDAGRPWDVVPHSPIEGGHYVPIIGREASGDFLVVTWGKVQRMTPAFLAEYNDESIAMISFEPLKNGVSPEGLDLAQLRTDLAAITAR